MKIYLKNLRNDATVEWRGGWGEWGEDREKDSEKNSQKTS